ncbi:MAG: RIP metalloprotease RseP [Porticoccaceae bacterium]
MEVVKIVFYALVALFILVTFHEFGHYWVARKCGVRVLRFSIGFGKPLLKWQRGDTEFALAGIPLGGYVKMYGESAEEEEIPPAEQHLSFSHKSVWQRMAIVVAGPVANLLLAIFIYFLVFLGGTREVAPLIGTVEPGSAAESAGVVAGTEIIRVDNKEVVSWAGVFEQLLNRIGETGYIELQTTQPDSVSPASYRVPINAWQRDTDQPDFLGSLGLVPYTPEIAAVIGQIVEGSPAQQAGLQVGDQILETDEVSIQNWEQWRDIVRASPGRTLPMLVERDAEVINLELTPEEVEENGEIYGLAGVAPEPADWPEELLRERDYGFFGAIQAGAEKTWSSSLFILDSLKKLITGQVSTKSLGGPVSIAKFAGASAEAGWQSFLTFLGIMSVMLGIMNLLPIPVLDGGHLLFYIIEAVKGSPLSEAIQAAAMRVGVSLVFGIMLLALYNDFMRL